MNHKNQELVALKALAKHLGPDSYVGPWLTDVIPQIEQDMRSDILPVRTYAQCREDCEAAVADARARAAEIVARAEREAAATIARAVQQRADIYGWVRDQLNRALHDIPRA